MYDYNSYIEQTAQKYEIQPDILKRLVSNESSGNINAISPKGAFGLTQLMPATAKEMGVDINDPLQNIEGGAKYLKQQLNKFNGDYSQALAAYNAGPNNKAVKSKNWDMLPSETKKYLAKFADFLIKPANASETPYQEPVVNNPVQSQQIDSNKIMWSHPDDVKLPDDNSTIKWEAPEEEHTQQPSNEKLKTSTTQASANGVADFGSAGFTDEIIGGGIAGVDTLLGRNKNLSIGEKYKLARDTVREQSDDSWKEHPVAYSSGAIAGGLLSPINKISAGSSLAQQGALLGGIYGTGSADETVDIPINAVIGATTGAIGGKFADSIGSHIADKTTNFRNEILKDVTQQELNNGITNIVRKTGGLPNESGSYPNQNFMDEMIKNGNQRVDLAYDKLSQLSKQYGADIQAPFTNAKLDLVNKLDNTALNQLTKKAESASALDKIANGMSINPSEAASLHKNLSRITGVDGETKFAIKNAQKALADDITSSNIPELSSALNDASKSYAQNKSMGILDDIVKKHIVQTDNGSVINYKTLSTGLKNWSLSKKGKEVIKYNPSIKEDIEYLQSVINSHPELKSLVTPLKEETNVDKLLNLAIKSSPSTLGGTTGGVIAGPMGVPVGVAIGGGTQLAFQGLKSLGKKGIETAIKSKVVQDLYRESLKKSLSGG